MVSDIDSKIHSIEYGVNFFFRKFCDSDLTEQFARDRLVFNVS